jgi:hypothetical protein
MPSALLSLAPELLDAITERVRIIHHPLSISCRSSNIPQVNKNDRKRLRLTCKYLGEFLESQVLHTIYLNIQHHNHSQATARLRSLATTKNLNLSRGLSRSSRRLHVGPLSPKPFSSLESFKYVGDELVQIPEPEDGSEVAVVEELMRTYLRDALDALRSLQFVTYVVIQFSVMHLLTSDYRWTPEEKDEAWTHEIIMDFLTSRPSLHTLKIELRQLRVAVPLHRMQDLREITFVERHGYRSSKPVRVQTYNNLAKLLASRPADQITKLSVVLTSLHEIFQFLTPEVEPLRLKELQMTQSFIKLDPFTIPHLRHLTCLHLLSMKNPTNLRTENSDTSEDTSPESSGDFANSEHRIGSKMSDFWSALRHVGIHLREIIVDSTNTGLFSYLSHYSGLTKLVVSTNVFNTSPESDALARLFFAEPLASHIETLKELAVYTSFQDLWCFGEHNISVFSCCTGLKKLGVSIAKADLPKARVSSGVPEVETAQSQPDVIVSSRV